MVKHNMYKPEELIKQRTVPEEKPVLGVVVNCDRLNVRKNPNRSSCVLTIIEEDEEVTIIMTKSTRSWYYVKTESGISGYCMTEYIQRKK